MPAFSYKAAYDEEAAKFGLTGYGLLPTDQQLAYIHEQTTEMRHIINRDLVDIVGLIKNRDEAKDEVTKAAYVNGITNKEGELRQFANKLEALRLLKEELEAEA